MVEETKKDDEKSCEIQQKEEETLASMTVLSCAPQSTREETVKTLNGLIHGRRPAPCDVHGRGPLLVSNVPTNARKEGVIMGIDEAGRGPVLGPMTYGAAYWTPSSQDAIPKGFNDSKALSAETRSRLFQKILETNEIGFVLRVLHASEISRNMLRSEPYNLNAMSHDAAMCMIQSVLDAGVKIDTCYVDTVGMPDAYRRQLEREFSGHGIRFVVEKKADAKYAPCSAASVVAKVSRDRMLESWKWSEDQYEPEGGMDFGSGYPSDPKCKKWLEKNLADPVFCFPDLVRFSWGPAKTAVKENGVLVEWEADEDDDDKVDSDGVSRQQTSMSSFVVGGQEKDSKRKEADNHPKKRQRLPYFESKRLTAVTKLVKS